MKAHVLYPSCEERHLYSLLHLFSRRRTGMVAWKIPGRDNSAETRDDSGEGRIRSNRSPRRQTNSAAHTTLEVAEPNPATDLPYFGLPRSNRALQMVIPGGPYGEQ